MQLCNIDACLYLVSCARMMGLEENGGECACARVVFPDPSTLARAHAADPPFGIRASSTHHSIDILYKLYTNADHQHSSRIAQVLSHLHRAAKFCSAAK